MKPKATNENSMKFMKPIATNENSMKFMKPQYNQKATYEYYYDLQSVNTLNFIPFVGTDSDYAGISMTKKHYFH